MRRYGETPKPGQIYRRRAGVYAILPRDGQILLTHQLHPAPEIQLPGGGIDIGEHPLAALHREVFEETGWHIGPPRRVGAFRRFTYMPEYDLWAEKVCTLYVARPVLRFGPPSEPGHRPLWMPLLEAADVLGNAGDRSWLLRWLAGQPR